MENSQGLYPLTFSPVFKDYPWGGRNLEHFGRTLPAGIVAESWDVAAHPNGSSPVRDGMWQGRALNDLVAELGEALVGERCTAAAEAGRFPLLIKLLDANTWLSVQVHPDDAYALAHEGEPGKTEMWVVLEAQPGAELLFGFNRPITKEDYAQAIADGRAEEPLHRMAVQKGDVVFVPPGAMHALGPGIVVAEIQQNSDTTYRVYDWGRPRPLHLEKALAVTNFDIVGAKPAVPNVVLNEDKLRVEVLAICPYFQTERLTMPAAGAFFSESDGMTFDIFGVLAGRARIEWDGAPVTLEAVDWVLIPAEMGEYQVVAETDAQLLRVFVP